MLPRSSSGSSSPLAWILCKEVSNLVRNRYQTTTGTTLGNSIPLMECLSPYLQQYVAPRTSHIKMYCSIMLVCEYANYQNGPFVADSLPSYPLTGYSTQPEGIQALTDVHHKSSKYPYIRLVSYRIIDPAFSSENPYSK